MATTEHFKNGGGTSFSFVFPILANSDLKVEIYNDTTKVWDLKTENTSGQTDNDYTISNTNVVFNSATPSGTGNVHIYRNTNVDNPAAVYAAGSSIRAVDLNDNQTQVLYSTQEAANQKARAQGAADVAALKAQGEEFRFNAQENREEANLERLYAEQLNAESRGEAARDLKAQAATAAIGAVGQTAATLQGGFTGGPGLFTPPSR